MTDFAGDGAAPESIAAEVAIIGGGVAGISLALRLPASMPIVLMTKSALGESNTRYAQGGLAAAVGIHDSAASHLRDTLHAGAGHCDVAAVRALVEGGPDAVAWLVHNGTLFDAAAIDGDNDGRAIIGSAHLALGHEAAHSHHRILHAHGDATGAEIERALVAQVRARPNIRILEHTLITDLTLRDGCCVGALGRTILGQQIAIAVEAVVLANGGAGRLWQRTSNPPGATADGITLAWRAGADLADLEFMQFHPTVLVPPDPALPAFLISEAVRGEGAYLRNSQGERFMRDYEGAELAPRDVVARGILLEMLREGRDHMDLDLSHLDPALVLQRFPTIAATCASIGIDITHDPIPVAPAAHYFMGGVAVDRDGKTTVPNLWAIGEVACTGVHGANRLASNSLLEGVVFGARAADDITKRIQRDDRAERSWPTTPQFAGEPLDTTIVAAQTLDPTLRGTIQSTMWERVSLYRDDAGLRIAGAELRALAAQPSSTDDGSFLPFETGSMATVAQLISAAAAARCESRGAHARSDYPALDAGLAGWRFFIRRGAQQPYDLSLTRQQYDQQP